MYKLFIIALSFGLITLTPTLKAADVALSPLASTNEAPIVKAAAALKALTAKQRKALVSRIAKTTNRATLQSAITLARQDHDARVSYMSGTRASRSLAAAPAAAPEEKSCKACCIAFIGKIMPTLGKTALQLIEDASSDGKIDGMGNDEVRIDYMQNLADIVNVSIDAIKGQA
jgi:hypothetical protein